MKVQDNFKKASLPSQKLDTNLSYLRGVFKGDETLRLRYATNASKQIRFCLVYMDGMVNNKLINDDVIKPLLEFQFPEGADSNLIDLVAEQSNFSNGVEKTSEMDKLIQSMIYGDTLLLMDGYSDALILNTKGWQTRSIEEPQGERVITGPREGFNESLLMNISMLRRKLRTPDLNIHFLTFGRKTRTQACLCYLGSIVKKSVLDDLQKRLDKIDIDGTLDTEYISELIKDKPLAATKTAGTTERPDVVAGKLLEGRVALFLDGTPQAITVPYLFIENFQSDEDYYVNFYYGTIGRILRIFSFIISTGVPALYVALTTFHQEILPTSLLISASQAREGVPFPTVLEIFIMLIVFEMLNETGSRIPGMMGQTLGIVGALVIGQAAVTAKIVSAPIIIIVGIAGICGLMVPKIRSFEILVQFTMLALVSCLGLYGFLFGYIGLLIHLYSIDSFGIPIMANNDLRDFQEFKDSYIRAPWWKMLKRPKGLTENKTRQSGNGAKK